MNIHPTAVIDPAAKLAAGVTVAPYAVIEAGVEIGAGSTIGEHVVIRAGTIIGAGCRIDAHAVLGGLPQDLSFKPETPSGVRIGANVTIREGVTVNRSTAPGGFTEVGDGCYLMANSHVAHDTCLGARVVLANGVLLAGKVRVGDNTFLGGGATVHQHGRIGEGAMISGMSRVGQDVPPFCMMAERNELIGLNLVGLNRRGTPREAIRELKQLYLHVFGAGGNPRRLAEAALREGMAKTGQGRAFLEFVAAETKRGVVRPRGEAVE